MPTPPRLLIEDWLPAAAIGVECMREEKSLTAKPPTKYFHVWWARRPLCISRAAVLASLLPADFPRDVFERLLGFGRPSKELVDIRRLMDEGFRVEGGFGCERAFNAHVRTPDLDQAHAAAKKLWGPEITVIDPMAGGGSIPLESARLGFRALANEYNPVACSVLEATVDYPFRHGEALAQKARKWAKVWLERAEKRLAQFFPAKRAGLVHAYIYARTVPCPDTDGHPHTPLVPDWHLLKPKSGLAVAAEPVVNQARGTWLVNIRDVGRGAGQLREVPAPTWNGGKGISLFSGQQISPDYIQSKALTGQMRSALYAIAVKTPQGIRFHTPEQSDLDAIAAAEEAFAALRSAWERDNVIPTEEVPIGDKTGSPDGTGTDMPLKRGERHWADMFLPRQLLVLGMLVEELRTLSDEIAQAEGGDIGGGVTHLLALTLDKFLNHNCILTRWENTRATVKGKMDRHDYAFKCTFAELAPVNSGEGFQWALGNTIKAYSEIAKMASKSKGRIVEVSLGSATNLPSIADGGITAVVVDPPYDDNVQYSELADFFYVWLKRTEGRRRPEWFSSYLCERDQEAVVNVARHREQGRQGKKGKAAAGEAKKRGREFYRGLMRDTFRECRRILREDGVLTVMFTHKKQEAWEALFSSMIQAGFTITATWPVKTESEHGLHQAKKNAAQSTVILVARKRPKGAGVGYFSQAMITEVRRKARAAAERLTGEGLRRVDQLVGSFGPAMEVFSRYDEVRTDTGQPVGVDKAIDEASEAVSQWRVEQLAARGLEGVEAEGKFALLCWDVLGAAEFRFNEAHLLGKAVGMDVEQLVVAGLVSKEGEKIKMLSAQDRRRERALEPDEVQATLFGPVAVPKKGTRKQVLKIHPNDPRFRTALDGCHALALRYTEANGGAAGIGSAKALARQQNWTKDSSVAKLMEALIHAAPEGVRFDKGKTSAGAKFPEFRAWHALTDPLFGIKSPEWVEKKPQATLLTPLEAADDAELNADGEEEGSDEDGKEE